MAVLKNLQRSLTYFPTSGPVRSARSYAPGARDVVLHTDDGLRLNAWWFPAAPGSPASAPAGPGAARGRTVLFTPGNGGNREGRVPLFRALAQRGFAVLGIDYRGYGDNPGTPSEAGLAADARAAADWLRAEGVDPGRTLYLGESLGTGVAARLATTHTPAGMLLRSPFPTLLDVARHLYPRLPVQRVIQDRYPTLDYLAAAPVPVTVLRGGADGIVPSELSARVARAVPQLVEDVEVPGADHNDEVWYGAFVVDAMVRLATATAAG